MQFTMKNREEENEEPNSKNIRLYLFVRLFVILLAVSNSASFQYISLIPKFVQLHLFFGLLLNLFFYLNCFVFSKEEITNKDRRKFTESKSTFHLLDFLVKQQLQKK